MIAAAQMATPAPRSFLSAAPPNPNVAVFDLWSFIGGVVCGWPGGAG